jgi:prolipoprotein diacylglyceryl transferase
VRPAHFPAFIPSPSSNVWHLGPIPIRAYALAIVTGIVVAIVVGNVRWKKRGGLSGEVVDIAIWAVPFGIVGGRIYHVLTDWNVYFGPHGHPAQALRIWEGGLGIWGAVFLGGVGAWIGARRHGIKLPPMADALAPGVVLAQAIGRLGNWFNQELFGKPTTLPWGLKIDPAHRPAGYENFATFHPTFLYELIWNVLVAAVVIWADKKFRMGHGRAFALYIGMYTAGRAFVESLRIDEAAFIFGIRFNFLLSIVVSVLAFAYLIVSARVRPGRETPAELHRSGWVRNENSTELTDMAAVLGTSGENGTAAAIAVRAEAVQATEVAGPESVTADLDVAESAPPDEGGTPDGKA